MLTLRVWGNQNLPFPLICSNQSASRTFFVSQSKQHPLVDDLLQFIECEILASLPSSRVPSIVGIAGSSDRNSSHDFKFCYHLIANSSARKRTTALKIQMKFWRGLVFLCILIVQGASVLNAESVGRWAYYMEFILHFSRRNKSHRSENYIASQMTKRLFKFL